MIAASLGVIARDLHIESRAVAQLSLSAFVLSYAFAPMFFGPLSEIFGRVRVLRYSNLFFLLWTVIGGFSESDAVLIVARLFAGLGGGAIYAVSMRPTAMSNSAESILTRIDWERIPQRLLESC